MRVWVSPETLSSLRKLEADCWRVSDTFDEMRFWAGAASMLPQGTLDGLPHGTILDLVVDWSLGLTFWGSRDGKPYRPRDTRGKR